MTNQPTVRIVTDSACDLSDKLAVENQITVVPLAIRFGDEEFIDRVELTNEAFWTRLLDSTELPSTAAPSSEAFAQAFRDAKAAGAESVVCINLSSKLSATYQAAVKGAESVEGEVTVHVIDSLQCTIAEGGLVLEAARMAGEGKHGAEIAAAIEDRKLRTKLWGTLDTLENLKRGGRIGAAGAFFASLLSVKPVITIADGEVKAESRQRTRRRAMEYLAKLVTDAGPITNVSVAHSDAPDIAEFLQQLAGVADPKQIPVSKIGPVIGTHGGPRLLAVSYVEEAP